MLVMHDTQSRRISLKLLYLLTINYQAKIFFYATLLAEPREHYMWCV